MWRIAKAEESIDVSLFGVMVGWMKKGSKIFFGGIECCKILEMGEGA